MGWDSKPVYPPDATHRVTVRATPHQLATWRDGFRIYMVGTNMATFLAWAGDFAIAFLRAQESLAQQKAAREKEEQEKRERREVYSKV
jgi:hypothetical protein